MFLQYQFSALLHLHFAITCLIRVNKAARIGVIMFLAPSLWDRARLP